MRTTLAVVASVNVILFCPGLTGCDGISRSLDIAAIHSTLAKAQAAVQACDGSRLLSLTSPTDASDAETDEDGIKEFNAKCRAKDEQSQELLRKIVLAEGMTPKFNTTVSAEFDESSLGTWQHDYQIRLVKYDGHWYLRGK